LFIAIVKEILLLFVVHQCNNFGGLSAVTQPRREHDLDLLTKPLSKDNGALSNIINNNDVAAADEFSSFMFWRQPLPSIDHDDLETILASQVHSPSDDGDGGDGTTSEFDEFNYWRVPVAHLDVADLLRYLQQL